LLTWCGGSWLLGSVALNTAHAFPFEVGLLLGVLSDFLLLLNFLDILYLAYTHVQATLTVLLIG
jgi:uncharacterized protein YhhL (DUF1145 family)